MCLNSNIFMKKKQSFPEQKGAEPIDLSCLIVVCLKKQSICAEAEGNSSKPEPRDLI